MKFLSTLLLLAGYTLVYAAVAGGGVFYSNPWMGLYKDAYGVDDAKQGKGDGNAVTPPAQWAYGNSPFAAPSARPRTVPPTTLPTAG